MSPPDTDRTCPSSKVRPLRAGETKCPACSSEAASSVGFWGKVLGTAAVLVGTLLTVLLRGVTKGSLLKKAIPLDYQGLKVQLRHDQCG